MLSSVLSSDSDDATNSKVTRRILRSRSDPLKLNENAFKKRFRLTKDAFNYVLKTLQLPLGQRSTATSSMIKLCAVLELLAKGSYQDLVGSDFMIGLAQPTVSQILWELIEVMERKLCPLWIKFNSTDETCCHFYNKFKIPAVLGCVDGTHIFLLRPKEDEHMFFNRKFSLNVMVVCDHNMKIMAVDPRYGGAAHDSFVWSHSMERRFLEAKFLNGDSNSWLLGDSGYPIEPWLITPYRNTENDNSKVHFNKVHAQARSVVERCIGIWKCRWRILLQARQPRYAPEKVAKIVNVCAALHNICIHYNIVFEEIIEEDVDLSTICNQESWQPTNYKRIGEHHRDEIRNSLEL